MLHPAGSHSAITWPMWWLAILGAGLVLAAPLLVTDLPPMGDYPNHLARMYVITHIGNDPILARIYEVVWNVVPNLAMDLIVPSLSHLVSLSVAGRLFIALSLLFPLVGVVVLHRAAFGQAGWWPLLAALVAYNGLFFWGFLNFVFGMGLALLAVALWLREPPRGGVLHLAALTALALILFVCHLEALALFAFTAGCIELCGLHARWRAHRLTLGTVVARGLRLATPLVIPVLLLLFAAPIGEDLTHKPLLLQVKEYYWATYNSWGMGKLAALGMPFASYSPLLDGLAAVAIALLYVVQIRRHGCRLNPGLMLACILLLVAFPFVPSVWMTAANLDCRLPVFAALLAFSGIAPNAPTLVRMRLGVVLVAVLLVVRVGVVGYAWAGSNDALAEFRRVIRPIQPGERVLVVYSKQGGALPPWTRRLVYDFEPGNLAPLLTMDRRAFWPTLFTSRTLQPVHALPPYREISVEQAEGPPETALTAPTPRDLMFNPYMANWRGRFDYILLVGARDLAPQAEPGAGTLRRVDGGGDLALFAIGK